MMRLLNDERHIAIHEAGHAVIGRALGLVCGEVTIVPNFEEREAGYSIVSEPDETTDAWEIQGRFRDNRTVLVARLLHAMAGAEAEIEILGRCEGGVGADRREVDRILNDIGYPETTGDAQADMERYEQRFRRHCRRLVRHHRDRIETVASMLLERRTIPGDELDDMIQPYRPDWLEPPFWASD